MSAWQGCGWWTRPTSAGATQGWRQPGGGGDGINTQRRCESKKSIVVIAVEVLEPPKGFGRIRLSRVRAATEENVLPFVLESIEPGSTIHTDGSWVYRSLPEHGFIRDRTVILGSEDPAHVSLPGVHRVASLLKRWLLGTHQGSVQPHQLDYYLDEFAFRFNRRSSRSRGLLFYRLLEQAVATSPVTYRAIAKNV